MTRAVQSTVVSLLSYDSTAYKYQLVASYFRKELFTIARTKSWLLPDKVILTKYELKIHNLKKIFEEWRTFVPNSHQNCVLRTSIRRENCERSPTVSLKF